MVQKGLALVSSGKKWKVEMDPLFDRRPCSFNAPEGGGGFHGRCHVWASVVGQEEGHICPWGKVKERTMDLEE